LDVRRRSWLTTSFINFATLRSLKGNANKLWTFDFTLDWNEHIGVSLLDLHSPYITLVTEEGYLTFWCSGWVQGSGLLTSTEEMGLWARVQTPLPYCLLLNSSSRVKFPGVTYVVKIPRYLTVITVTEIKSTERGRV
jgi:hypothetical protein